MTTQDILRQFDEMTDTHEFPEHISGANEWLQEHSKEHLYENDVYGEPMFDLSPDKVRAFLIQSLLSRDEEIAKMCEEYVNDYCEKYKGCGMADSMLAIREFRDTIINKLTSDKK